MRTGIALGSNQGDLLDHLSRGKEMIFPFHQGPVETFLYSPVYRTAPVDCPPGSAHFYNAVVEMDWEGSARQLLEVTSSIEYSLGRRPTLIRNAPRQLDLDILYIGDEMTEADDLIIPHPRIAERLFVLKPLSDIAPGKIIPGVNKTSLALLAALHLKQDDICLVTREW